MPDPCGDYSLKCHACRQKVEKWERYIDRIFGEMGLVSQDEEIFRRVVDVMERARIYELDGTFYKWIGSVYQEAISLRVRRLLDTDAKSQTFSLRSLLDDIEENPKVMSRERFLALYASSGFPADGYFDDLAGAGSDYLSPMNVRADITMLEEAAKRVIDTADRRFAHLDRTPPSDIPTWADVKACVELLEAVVTKYRALVKGTALNAPIRNDLPPGWTHVFRSAWNPR
jgi:hypothetical protein